MVHTRLAAVIILLGIKFFGHRSGMHKFSRNVNGGKQVKEEFE